MNQFIYKKTILVLQHRYKLCILLFYSCWLFLFWCVIKEKCVYPAGARLYVFFINSLHLLGWHWFIGPYRSLHRMHTTQSQIIFCHHGFGPVYPLVPFTHFHLATITLLSVSLSFCSSKCIKCIAGSYVTFSFISQLWMQSYGSWLFPSDWFHWARFSLLISLSWLSWAVLPPPQWSARSVCHGPDPKGFQSCWLWSLLQPKLDLLAVSFGMQSIFSLI